MNLLGKDIGYQLWEPLRGQLGAHWQLRGQLRAMKNRIQERLNELVG